MKSSFCLWQRDTFWANNVSAVLSLDWNVSSNTQLGRFGPLKSPFLILSWSTVPLKEPTLRWATNQGPGTDKAS